MCVCVCVCVLSAGHYPHPDVPSVPNAVAVQKEVVYCPQLSFIAYDIAVTCREHRGTCIYNNSTIMHKKGDLRAISYVHVCTLENVCSPYIQWHVYE